MVDSDRPHLPHKHRRSLNVLVIGGSGAGKSRTYVKPNILEANTNYVITDPKSEVLLATGGYLKSRSISCNFRLTRKSRIFSTTRSYRPQSFIPCGIVFAVSERGESLSRISWANMVYRLSKHISSRSGG